MRMPQDYISPSMGAEGMFCLHRCGEPPGSPPARPARDIAHRLGYFIFHFL
jgi:hypothetical protein